MAKEYGPALELHISSEQAEWAGMQVDSQERIREDHSTLDHIFIHRALIEGARQRKQNIYCCFVDFCKSFDLVS